MTELLCPSDALEQLDKLIESVTSTRVSSNHSSGNCPFEIFCFINLIYQTAGELLHMVMGVMEMLRLNTKCECELD